MDASVAPAPVPGSASALSHTSLGYRPGPRRSDPAGFDELGDIGRSSNGQSQSFQHGASVAPRNNHSRQLESLRAQVTGPLMVDTRGNALANTRSVGNRTPSNAAVEDKVTPLGTDGDVTLVRASGGSEAAASERRRRKRAPGGSGSASSPSVLDAAAMEAAKASKHVRHAPRRRSSARRMEAIINAAFVETMWNRNMVMSRWTLLFVDTFVENQYRRWALRPYSRLSRHWAGAVILHGLLCMLVDALVVSAQGDGVDVLWMVARAAALAGFFVVTALCLARSAANRLGARCLHWAAILATVYGCTLTLARAGMHHPGLESFNALAFMASAADVCVVMVLLASPLISPLEFTEASLVTMCTLATHVLLVALAAVGGGAWDQVEASGTSEAAAATLLPVGVTCAAVLAASYRHTRRQRDRFCGCWWDVHDKEADNRALGEGAQDEVLTRLTDTIRTGKLRSLIVKAMGVDKAASRDAKDALKAFVDTTRALLESAGEQDDSRYRGLLTAANAVSVADQWLDRVKQIETGGFGGDNTCQVFLGGSCNPTTWRKDVAIPRLEAAGITYYNPQVDDWTPDLIELETKAKNDASCLLFVIDGLTRAIVSMNEVTELICRGRTVVLVVQDIDPATTIDDQPLADRERKDLNRGRAYLLDLARRYAVPTFNTVEAAVNNVATMFHRSWRAPRGTRVDTSGNKPGHASLAPVFPSPSSSNASGRLSNAGLHRAHTFSLSSASRKR